jgi:outer membrane protein
MKSKIMLAASVFLLHVNGLLAQSKMGYINSLELLSYMPDIKAADSILADMANDMQALYVSYVKEYQAKLDDYNANIATLSPEIKSYKEEEILSLEERIRKYEQTSQDKIQAKKQELYGPIIAKANSAIQTVAKDEKFTCVIDSSSGALIYAGDDMINIMALVKTKLNIN